MSDRRRGRDDRREVDDLVAELEDTLAALRDAAEESGGLVPPRSREFLRLTDEYAIPTAIAFLEANVRALEFLQGAIRVMDPGRSAVGDARAASGGAVSLGRASMERIERALDDVEAALTESPMPRDRDARRLLTEARRLNDEIRDQIGADEAARDRDAVRIDVESELETIKDEVGGEGTEGGSAAGDDEAT